MVCEHCGEECKFSDAEAKRRMRERRIAFTRASDGSYYVYRVEAEGREVWTYLGCVETRREVTNAALGRTARRWWARDAIGVEAGLWFHTRRAAATYLLNGA